MKAMFSSKKEQRKKGFKNLLFSQMIIDVDAYILLVQVAGFDFPSARITNGQNAGKAAIGFWVEYRVLGIL